jgi:hypothetical protein
MAMIEAGRTFLFSNARHPSYSQTRVTRSRLATRADEDRQKEAHCRRLRSWRVIVMARAVLSISTIGFIVKRKLLA